MKNKKETCKKFNFWPYFAKHKLAIGFYLTYLLIDVAIQTFYAIYGATILVAIAEGAFQAAIEKFLVMLAVILISLTIQYFRHIIYFKISNKVTNAMRVDIAIHSFNISDRAYAEHQTSNFTQRIASDPQTIFNSLHNLVRHIQGIMTTLIMVIYIVAVSPILGSIGVLTVASLIILEKFRKKINKKNKKELHTRNEKTGALLNEIVRSQKDIKSLNLEKELKSNIIELTDSQAEQSVKTNVTDMGLLCFKAILINILITVLMVIALIFLDKGLITLTMYMIVHNNRHQISNLSNYLGDVFGYFTDIDLAVMRIGELYEDNEYEIDKFGKKVLNDVQGEIEFKNVGFGYVEYKDKTEEEIKEEIKQNKKNKIKERVKSREVVGKKQVFKDISFKIEPNTSVAFVGKSGSGKTTILNLISKMYEADKGKVLIDGVDVKKLSKDTLRSSISLVNQFPYIFDMTIKENMLLAKPDATDEEIDLAVKEAALDDFIETLPNGLDTKVGESGIKLSGGQKQRVAIARAMLRKSSIVIFDESTSSLDNIAQAQIKKSIDNIKGKSTVVIVAHRLSTIKNVDKIFFLEEGEIVDSGTFQELYKRNKNFKQIFLAENI